MLVGGALALVTISALAATNSVPATKAGRATSAIGVNELKPAACAALTLTAISVGDGGGANELVVGTAAARRCGAAQGTTALLGGGGNDTVRGDQGTDVCIGGLGTDTLHATCETQIQ